MQMFGKLFDIPSEMLSPEQLKVDIPAELAAQLYGFWVKTIQRKAEKSSRRNHELAGGEVELSLVAQICTFT